MVWQRSTRGSDMMLGAGLVLVGMVAGAALFTNAGPAAYAAGPAPPTSDCLPAIALLGSDAALAKESQGHYVIITSSGWAKPVRVRDSDLRSSPGESFVFAP